MRRTHPPSDGYRLAIAARESAAAVEALDPGDPISVAAAELAHAGVPAVPVVSGGRLAGAVSEQGLAAALARGASPSDAIGPFVEPGLPQASEEEPGAAVLRLLDREGVGAAFLVDSAGRPTGVVTASRLLAPPEPAARPRLVGGMATPFGVYLTNGVVGGGAGGWALVSTGVLLFSLFAASVYATNWVGTAIPDWAAPAWSQWLGTLTSTALFFVGLRSMPLAGIHAAEHKVVHALERGLPLTLETVSRMPRVHPRCGTNLVVGLMLFLGLATARWTDVEELRLVVAAFGALVLWRPVGALVQAWVTTKPPTAAQLRSGIRAAEDLLERASRPAPYPGLGRRILCSGLPHIVAGSALAQLAVWGLETALRVPAAYRVVS